ncbi:MAG: hypothetical protein ACJAT3_001513 [Akkermansiaceae bacterium]|jgi:hypothetical protein
MDEPLVAFGLQEKLATSFREGAERDGSVIALTARNLLLAGGL